MKSYQNAELLKSDTELSILSIEDDIPEKLRYKAVTHSFPNTIDPFLTSNHIIYFPTVSSPLGNSAHCLITLRHGFLPHLDFPLPHKECSTTARLLLTLGLQAFQMVLPLLLLSSPTQYFLAWISLFSLFTSLVKNSPKWFISQCVKAVNNKNHYFKEWKRLQTKKARASFIHSHNVASKP